jgi:GntR family transcriptional regulator/MocR family aminotransferase
MRQVLNSGDEKLLQRMTANGVLELRFAICQYLLEFRNMSVAPNQIVVGSGTEALYTMLVQLLGRNSVYAVENPGYKKVATVFEINGANYVPINIEKNGINIEDLEQSCANVIHISPSHHFPTGLVMPVRCRGELLDWAAKSENRFIIEDDYDSEFRFNGKPLQTLQSSDTNDCVIYINTFSKSLASTIRISYMVLPEALMERYKKELSFYSCTVSNFEQYTLAAFIEQGYFEKHINRMRNYYRTLRDQVMTSIKNHKLYSKVSIKEDDSGLHFLMSADTSFYDEELILRAENRGVNLSCLSSYYHKKEEAPQHTFIINYSGLSGVNVERAVEGLFDIIDE